MLAMTREGENAETDFREIDGNIYSVGVIYMAAGSLTAVLMIFGILSDRIRRKSYVYAYIAFMVVATALFGVAG